MTDLIKALTRLANAAAEYLEKGNSPLLPLVAPAEAVAELFAPKKERKARTPKAEASAPAATAPAPADINDLGPAPTAAPTKTADLSEEDSVKEIRAAARIFVQRYPTQTDGTAAFRRLIAERFKVAKIDDLVHAQRLAIIAEVKGGATPTPAATTTARATADLGV